MQFGAFLTFYCQFSPSSPSPAFMASKRIIGLLSFPIAHLLPSTGTGFVNALGFTHCDDACASPTPDTGGRDVGEGASNTCLDPLYYFFSCETRDKIGSVHFSGILPQSQNFHCKFSSLFSVLKKEISPNF